MTDLQTATLRLGTRASQLALTQSQLVADALSSSSGVPAVGESHSGLLSMLTSGSGGGPESTIGASAGAEGLVDATFSVAGDVGLFVAGTLGNALATSAGLRVTE